MSFLRKFFGNEAAAVPQTAPLSDPGGSDFGTAPLDPEAVPDALPTPPAESESPWWEDAAPALPPSLATAPLARDVALPDAADAGGDPVGTALLNNAAALEAAPRGVANVAPLPGQRGLAAVALRDIGQVRSINQDSVLALLTTIPRESNDFSVGLFIVADGMGGHDSGEVASRLAINAVAHEVISRLILPALAEGISTDMQSMVVAAVQAANRAIWEHARAVGSDMGTTCTAAVLLGHALYIGHVGDSRLYVRTPRGLECITDDHSTVGRLIKMGQLEPSEAREHPLRSQLYRTVGQTPDVVVDYSYYQLGDATHLLVCSDGLWSLLDDAVIRDTLDQYAWPHDTCRALITHANNAGGDDNISAVVVTLPKA